MPLLILALLLSFSSACYAQSAYSNESLDIGEASMRQAAQAFLSTRPDSSNKLMSLQEPAVNRSWSLHVRSSEIMITVLPVTEGGGYLISIYDPDGFAERINIARYANGFGLSNGKAEKDSMTFTTTNAAHPNLSIQGQADTLIYFTDFLLKALSLRRPNENFK
jgi:hypothetical protein